MEELTKEELWNLATTLNKVDGLSPSLYLEKLIKENLEDKVSLEEIIKKLKEHYKNEKRDN